MKHRIILKQFYIVLITIIVQPSILQASELENYHIKKCSKNKVCWTASGPMAYIASNGTYLSAEKGKLEIVDLNKKTSEQWSCGSISYNLTTELIICNNSEGLQTNKIPSVIIDGRFNVNKISINLALHSK